MSKSLLATESDIKASIDFQLRNLGWQPDPLKNNRNVFRESPKTKEEKDKLNGQKPDFILYADKDSNQSTVIIEAKRPNKSLVSALEQGRGYARLLGTPLVVATDGYRVKTWHVGKKSALLYNDIEVDELFKSELANHFVNNPIYESFCKQEYISKQELINKFKMANNILRDEGLAAGIVRFSEFANLMFLKLNLEGGKSLGSGHSWSDIENKRGKALLRAVKSMLDYLNKEYSKLFRETEIKDPANMEKLINILSSFKLSGIKDDIKGMAFEYFIHSYTQGTKNDLGQYFTPRHIVKMMVDYLRPQLGEKIYDPFCGTGGMLIESFRYIKQTQKIRNGRDQKILNKETIYGRDNSSVARIAMMNMIMFGDGHSNIQQGDSYKRLGGEKYDIVITNIPFSQTTEFEEGYPVSPKGDKNGDSIGVQHCLQSLSNSKNARAAIIVPIGFIYKDGLQHEREYIVNNFHLDRIVELTPKCFNPYTEQQTAILMLRRKHSKDSPKTVYYYVKNDGFSQNGYRVPLPGDNDVDKAMEEKGGKEVSFNQDDKWKYKKIAVKLKQKEVYLSKLAVIHKGASISPKTMLNYTIDGKHPIIMAADLAKNHIDYCLDESNELINNVAVSEKKLRLHDECTIVIPTSGKSALLNHRAMLGKPAYLSSTVTGISAKENSHPYYLFYWLLRWDAEVATYDLGYPGLSTSVLRDIAIPIKSPAETKHIISEVSKVVALQKQFKEHHRSVMNER